VPLVPIKIQPSPLLIDPPLPADSALRPAIDDLVARLKLSFTMAANDVAPRVLEGVDRVFHDFLATRRPEARSTYRTQAQRLLARPDLRAQHFGLHASMSPPTYQLSGFKGLPRLQVPKSPTTRGTPKLSFGTGFAQWWKDQQAKQKQAADEQAGQAYKKMRLKILDVHCFDGTSELGADEIAIGGVFTGPFGGSLPVNETMVSDDFHEGDDVGMHLTFCEWGIDQQPGWPHYYGAIVMLCEKDDGGFWDMIHNLWEQVAPEVKALIAAGVGAAIGGTFGGALGAIVGAVVGGIVGWIISIFDNADDLLGVRHLTMTLAADTKSYYDWAKLTAPGGYPFHLDYYGDDSHYRVTGAFKVYQQ
jgi:hypothetical protein